MVQRAESSGGEGNMLEERVTHLERDVSAIKTDVASIKAHLDAELPHLATKADIQGMANRLIMWSVTTIIAGGGLVFVILEFFGKGG